MSLHVDHVAVQLTDAAPGSYQDITIPDFGFPDAAIFLYNAAETLGVPTAHARLGVGFAAIGNQFAASMRAADAQGTSDTLRLSSRSALARLPEELSTSTFLEYSLHAWIADGVRIRVDTAPSSPRACVCILLKGVADACCGTVDLGTGTAAIPVTDPGFSPDLVLFGSAANALDGVNAGAHFSFGAAVNEDPVVQYASMVSSGDGAGAATPAAKIADDKVAGESGAYEVALTSFDAAGFTVTPTASAGGDSLGYLALRLKSGSQVKAFPVTVPDGGDYIETGAGFQPGFGLLTLLAGVAALNTEFTSGAPLLSAGVTAFNGSQANTIGIYDEDAADPSNTGNFAENSLTLRDPADESNLFLTSAQVMTALGWDFTLSANPSADVLGFGLAFAGGPSVAAGVGRVQGDVIIEGEGVSRRVVGFTYDPVDTGAIDEYGDPIIARRVCGETVSAGDGTFSIDCPGQQGPVICVALDDYGNEWEADKDYIIGQRIHPTQANQNGYVYECTAPGNSGPTEPTWWPDTGGGSTGFVGTATFKAVESWWPIAHAPLTPIWTPGGVSEVDPLFASVVANIHADSGDGSAASAFDQFANDWEFYGAAALQPVVTKFGSPGAIYFDGSTSNIRREGTLADGEFFIDPGMTDIAIDVWIYPISLDGTRTIFGQYVTGDADRTLFQIIDGKLYFFHGEAGSITGTTGLVPNAWQYVSYQFENDGVDKVLRAYLNGQLEFAFDLNGITGFAERWFSIGARHNGGASVQDFFHGYMDDIRGTRAVRHIGQNAAVPTGPHPDAQYA